MIRDGPLEKGWGGGGPFPTCTVIFSKCFACVDFFEQLIPCSNFIFFPKLVGERGGEKKFSGLKTFFRTYKKGVKKFPD